MTRSMRFRAIAWSLVCAVQALAAAAPVHAQTRTSPEAADYIVAVVNSEPITNGEVRLRANRFAQQLRQQGAPIPPTGEFLRQVVERLITEKAQLQMAREDGMKIEDTLVDQAEQHIARSNQMSVEQLHRGMQAEGSSVEQFRNDLRDQLMLQRLREREFSNKGRVTELEIDQYLAQQQAGAKDGNNVELNLGHILVAVPENANEAQLAQAQAKAQRALERARAGEDFAKLGQEYTDGRAIGATGTPVGPRSVDRLPPLFVQAVQNVPEGGVSNVVRSAAGFHIVKVFERRRGGLPGATVVQSHARHILLRPGANLTEPQAVQKLADFKRRILAGQADFAQLAREVSQDASARDGGDLGWASPGMFVPEFEEAMNSLAPGQIADPVITRFGVHLVQLLERRQATLSDKELREVARNTLREKKTDEAYEHWAEDLRGRAWVEYRDPPQ